MKTLTLCLLACALSLLSTTSAKACDYGYGVAQFVQPFYAAPLVQSYAIQQPYIAQQFVQPYVAPQAFVQPFVQGYSAPLALGVGYAQPIFRSRLALNYGYGTQAFIGGHGGQRLVLGNRFALGNRRAAVVVGGGGIFRSRAVIRIR